MTLMMMIMGSTEIADRSHNIEYGSGGSWDEKRVSLKRFYGPCNDVINFYRVWTIILSVLFFFWRAEYSSSCDNNISSDSTLDGINNYTVCPI